MWTIASLVLYCIRLLVVLVYKLSLYVLNLLNRMISYSMRKHYGMEYVAVLTPKPAIAPNSTDQAIFDAIAAERQPRSIYFNWTLDMANSAAQTEVDRLIKLDPRVVWDYEILTFFEAEKRYPKRNC